MGLFDWNPFNTQEEERLKEAITLAEEGTRGEIRLHVDRYCKTNALFKAANLFKHLGMEQTEDRSGVLIYVALEERKFAIIGDIGIDLKVGKDFWEEEKELMLAHFREGAVIPGLLEAIRQVGLKLKTHFPAEGPGNNELSNEISFGS